MVEQLPENYVGALASDITASALSLTLATNPGTALPATGDIRLRLSDVGQTVEEVIWATTRSGATWSWPDTTHRGTEDPTGIRPARDWPAAGTIVEAVLTGAALEAAFLRTVAHSATTGQTENDHHPKNHNLRSTAHPDVTTTGTPADGSVLTYSSSTSKWGPAVGAGVGYVHTPDRGIDHQYVDPFRGLSGNRGTSWGDAMPSCTEAAANLTTPGNGTIEICAGRYDISDNPADLPGGTANPGYLDSSFDHKAQLIAKGSGMRAGSAGGTEINWIGGDGDRATGTCTASVGATSITALGGSQAVKHVGSGVTPDNDDKNHLVRIAGAGYGGADLVTWVSATADTTHFTILDPIITAVTAATWIIYRPKFLWHCGRRDWSQSWGSQGGLKDIMFNVDGDRAIDNLRTHRNNLVFVGICNGQNGGWFRRVRCGDRDADPTDIAKPEIFRDSLFGIYAFSADVVGKGAGGLGMNYLRDLWMFGCEYSIITALSTNPVEISGASNTGKTGRSQIYIARGGATNAMLTIPYWKSELRDRYISNPYDYATDGGNAEDTAGGSPFLIDIADPMAVITASMLLVQQESGKYSRGSTTTPSIPAIRYQPTEFPPLFKAVIEGTKFPKAFAAPGFGTTYDKSFPVGSGPRAVSIDTYP